MRAAVEWGGEDGGGSGRRAGGRGGGDEAGQGDGRCQEAVGDAGELTSLNSHAFLLFSFGLHYASTVPPVVQTSSEVTFISESRRC